MMNRAKVLMAAALLVGGATACSDLTGTSVRADGVYLLRTINGTSLPFTTTDNLGNTTTVQSDTYSVNSDGSYSELGIFRINGSQGSQSESGTWTQSNTVVTFTPSQSSINNFTIYQGTLSNSNVFGGTRTLTISINGITGIYSE
jgi:hypothetical protein